MCKIQHLCDTVYHCIAKGYDRIDASKADAIDKIRKKAHIGTSHFRFYFRSFLIRAGITWFQT